MPLSPAAKKIMEGVRADTGIPKTEALTRILEWFASQDRKLRLAILTRDEGTREELTRIAMREMANLPDPTAIPGDVEESFRLLHGLATKLETAYLDLEQAARQHLPGAKKK